MNSVNGEASYLRASQELQSVGIDLGERPELTLDEARAELATSLALLINKALSKQYGPLIGEVSEPTVTAFLENLESSYGRAKHDLTLFLEEITDRILKKNHKAKD